MSNDSIYVGSFEEMNAAADSLSLVTGEEWKRLNVKKQFYERKLQEDLKKK